MKLLQYQESVNGIPNSLAPERVTSDKWQPNTEIPQSNWRKAALYSAAAVMPFVAFVNLGQPERTTPDKWQPETNRPVFDVKRTQVVYPTFVIDGKQFTLSERITPDKWQPETNRPLFDVKRQQQTYPSFFFNPLPIEETADIQMAGIYQTPVPYLTVRHTEYLFPSLFYDARSLTQPEVLKVLSSQPLVLSYPRSTQYQALAFVTKLNAVVETVTLDKWNHDTDRPTPDVKRSQYLYPTSVIDANQLTQKERVSSDKWQPETNKPLFDIKRQQYLYPFESQNILPIEEGAEIQDAGIYQTNAPYFPIKHAEYLYQHFGIDPTQLTQRERITLDKWFKETEHNVWDRIRNQNLYPTESFNPLPLPPTEVITPDKWQSKTNEPKFDVPRTQYLHPSFVTDVRSLTQPETLKVFTQEHLVLSYPRSTQYQSLTFTHEAIGSTSETVSLDKWFRETQRPVFDIKRQQYLFPSFFANPYGLTLSEVVKVFNGKSVVLYTVRTTQYRGLTLVSLGVNANETITLNKWFRATEQPFFIPHNHGYIQYVFEPRRRLPTSYTDTYNSPGTNFNDKYSTRNSSYGDKYSSRNSTYSDKYSGRGSGYSDKYSQRNTPYSDKYPTS